MLKMTFDEYDAYLEAFKKMKTPTFYPSPLIMEHFDPNDRNWILFACYLYECGKKVKNKAESYSRKTLREFINENLELYDEQELGNN